MKSKFCLVYKDKGVLVLSMSDKGRSFSPESKTSYLNIDYKIEDGVLYFEGTKILYEHEYNTDLWCEEIRWTEDQIKTKCDKYIDFKYSKKTSGIFKKKEYYIIEPGWYELKKTVPIKLQTSNFRIYEETK